MKVRINKTSATIQFETAKEIEAFALACEHYVEIVYEGDNLPQDKIMLDIGMKFRRDIDEE